MSVQIRFGAGSAEKSAYPCDPRIRASMRRALADEIERLLRIIDALDGDPDLEPDADGEPSLGWSHTMAIGTADDMEQGEVTP
ncbi:hypothetical protein GCM10011390_50490 [Aureimonas endophytica]|uniref:Uncharacterized protein n=1 Tax=Aureimonas endophytica TaxID=2027858 RepID=A0A917A4Q8_9HYPH|nr:hypothetical protein GCM10011390_50490 [Aureimonas endophytica]